MPKFDRENMSIAELKKQPISVVETEITSLAKTLGIQPAELFRSINPGGIAGPSGIDDVRLTDGAAEQCCHSDSW